MSTTVVLAQAEEAVRDLPVPPWLVGVMALVGFAFLLAVTWSFRGTAQKYARPDLEGDRRDATATGPHGSAADDAPHWPEHPGHQH